MKTLKNKLIISWKEWCSLKELGLPAIKAKIDTGAKTSSLHAFNLEAFHYKGAPFIQFDIHPLQRKKSLIVTCRCPIVDRRYVSDSGGHRELRYVIQAELSLGEKTWPIEITLANRDTMTFRMLLGRKALTPQIVIDPSKTHPLWSPSKKEVLHLYRLSKDI